MRGYRVILRRYGLLISVMLLYIVFGLVQPKFFGVHNLINIFRQASLIGILALGLTFIVSAGEFDLSFASIAAMVSCFLVNFMMMDMNVYLAIVICLGIGLLAAMVSYVNVIYIGIPSFVASLAMMNITTGIARYVTGGGVIYAVNYPDFFNFIGRGKVLGIPTPVIWLIILSVIAVYFLEFTKSGRYIYAVGGNSEAAVHVGINIIKTKLISYLIFGLLSGFAGLIMGSLFGSGNPDVGAGYTFPGIIATLLGGAFIKDGTPNARGTLVAALLLATIQNGFTMTSVPFYMKEIVLGIILIIAIGLITVLRGKPLKLGF